MATIEKRRGVAADIQLDMERDATHFDGQPFNGKTVATYFGNQGAAIAALAHLVESLLTDIATLETRIEDLEANNTTHLVGKPL